ncbi:hypothetical protein [Thauera sp.]
MDCAEHQTAAAASSHRRSVATPLSTPGELERLRHELAGLMSVLGSRAPSVRLYDALFGLWIDSQGHASMPDMGACRVQPADGHDLRIVEAISVDGVWMLLQLGHKAGEPSRADLLASVMAAFGHDEPQGTTGRFVPIYSADAEPTHVQQEMEHLKRLHGDLTLAPRRPDLSPWHGRT